MYNLRLVASKKGPFRTPTIPLARFSCKLSLSAASSSSRQASHIHVDDKVDERDEARIAVGEAPVRRIAQLLVGRTVIVGGPGGAHDVHQVAVGHSEHVLEAEAMFRSVSMLRGNC